LCHAGAIAISDDQVVELIPLLVEAARASERSTNRFVPPRPGIVGEAAARRHQFVFGRRGVGKSSLLRVVEKEVGAKGGPVAFIDLETLRGVPYPDVLIRLLIELVMRLDERLAALGRGKGIGKRFAIRRQRRRLRKLQMSLNELLGEPQSAEHVVRRLKSRSKSAGGEMSLGLSHRAQQIAARANSEHQSSQHIQSEARFIQTKMEGLFAASPVVRSILSDVMSHLDDAAGFIILDDFYHIPQADQPDVLGYLHQIVKNLDLYLKVCGVRHRLIPFIEGDPPIGLQVDQDAGQISLDVTLSDFLAAQQFLERVLNGLASPLTVTVDELITDGGRNRLVLGSGGVARDYLNLVAAALRTANSRPHAVYRPHNRITAEDVNEASAQLSSQKQNDLLLDSGPDADEVRERLADVARFCLDYNGTNVFLVEGTKLDETEWGKQIQSLADLRLIHEIGNVAVQSSDYRGRRFVAFTLDLSNYTGTRSEHIRQIEFWTPAGGQDIRRVGLRYEPGYDEMAKPLNPTALTSDDGPVNWEEPPLPGLEGP
jgi:hypothetical protein